MSSPQAARCAAGVPNERNGGAGSGGEDRPDSNCQFSFHFMVRAVRCPAVGSFQSEVACLNLSLKAWSASRGIGPFVSLANSVSYKGDSSVVVLRGLGYSRTVARDRLDWIASDLESGIIAYTGLTNRGFGSVFLVCSKRMGFPIAHGR
jgi:hypothetical protein